LKISVEKIYGAPAVKAAPGLPGKQYQGKKFGVGVNPPVTWRLFYPGENHSTVGSYKYFRFFPSFP